MYGMSKKKKKMKKRAVKKALHTTQQPQKTEVRKVSGITKQRAVPKHADVSHKPVKTTSKPAAAEKKEDLKAKQPLIKEPEAAKKAEKPEKAEKPKAEKKAKSRSWVFALIMAAVLIYDELLLHHSSGFPFSSSSLISIALFSLSYGCLFSFLTSFFRNTKINRIARGLIMTAIAVWFLVCFFVHKQFKVFYDLATMSAGASDALGQFQANVKELLLSSDGLIRIVLYLCPPVLYLIYGHQIDRAEKTGFKTKLITFLCFCLCLAAALGSVYQFGSWDTLLKQYNFTNAISSFGLSTATLLDGRKMVFPDSMLGFEKEYTKLIHTTSKAGEKKIEWNKNELTFDWSKLSENASSAEKSLDAYVASQSASNKNEFTGLFEGKNLIILTAEAFSDEIVSEELTPTLYRLIHKGFYFTDYYQPSSAGTTGGEYEIVFGMLPSNGGSSFKNMAEYNNCWTMGSVLNNLGYEGWAFHNNTYTFYDRDLTHNNLGYSHGFMGYGNGMEEFVEWVWPESDVEMISGTMPMYENAEYFNVYYMTVSGHNGYDYGTNSMSLKHWDKVQNLNCSERLKGYIACNLELEEALTYLVNRLEELGKADDTVIVLSADHFPYGLDDGAGFGSMTYLSELYGHNVTDFLDRDHNGLIIWSGMLEDREPVQIDAPVSSLDILPTLLNLFGIEFDSRIFPGRDVFSDAEPLVFTIFYDWKTELGSYNSLTDTFTPNEGAVIPEGYEERIKKIVRNKINYCAGYNNTDYFNHLFPKQ